MFSIVTYSAHSDSKGSFTWESTRSPTPPPIESVAKDGQPKRNMKFWLCFASLLLPTFLIALDLTSLSTPLPTIITDLHGSEFEWAGAAYALSATALQPFCGALAQVFGRRSIMLVQIFLFALGSLVSGVSQSLTVFIVGRTIQGVGAGGIAALGQIVLGDLVPLQQRGVFTGLLAMAYACGVGFGPLVGGALAGHTRWRWLFYMNLPVCAVAAVLVFFFVKLKVPTGTWREKVSRLDWTGNFIVIGSTTACVLALTWGGIKYSWSSIRVILPLVLGVLGLAGFLIYESKVPKNPLVPFEVIKTRTAVSGLVQTFFTMFMAITVVYYLPIYFLACRVVSPVKAGLDLFGISQTTMPFGLIAGITIAKSGRYRPQLWFAWVVCIVGMALLSTLNADSHKGLQIGYQIVTGSGMGVLLTSTVFPVLAEVEVVFNASALAFYMFVRYMSQIWGVTAGGAILQNELKHRLPSDLLVDLNIPTNTSVAYSIIPLIRTFPEPLRTEVRRAFASSLRPIWLLLVGVSCAGLAVSIFMKGIPLNNAVDENWGLEGKKEGEKVDNASGSDAVLVSKA